MSYDNIFGGSAVYPSNQTYTAIDLTTDINLAWPIESVSTNIIVADLMDITPETPGGWNVILPDATGGSTGITMIMNNLSGTFDFNVKNNIGSTILNIPPGTVWLIYLVDNSTAAGVWNTFQYGAQTGSVNVAAIAGAGLLAIGSSLNQSMPVSAKGTNYTVVNDDRASVILWTGAAGTLTLPTASAVGSNWFVNVTNKGSGNLAVSPPSGTIDGSATKNFPAGTGSAIVFTDGTNYYTVGFASGSGGSSGFDYTTINAAGSDLATGSIVLSGGQLDRISYKVFGALTGARSITVPASTQEYWINNATTSVGGPWPLTIKTAAGGGVTVSQPGQAILYCDGTDVVPAVSGVALPVPISSGGTGSTTAPAARTALGSTSVGDALFTTPSAAAARTTLGAGTTGSAIFVAATPSVALTAMNGGTLTGNLTITGLFTTATLTATGMITAGGVNVTGATIPVNGMYNAGANTLRFSTNSISAISISSTQVLTFAQPLPIASGGTSANTLLGAANALGDATATANTLAQRDVSGYLWAGFFNMSGAVDTTTVIDNVMFNRNADGFIRRTSLAHFSSILAPVISGSITPDSLSTATGTAPSYSARAWARVSSAGALIAGQNINSAGRSSVGLFFITFTNAMADANYAVIVTPLHVAGNFIIGGHEAEVALVVKTASQVGIQIINSGGSVDATFSVVIYR